MIIGLTGTNGAGKGTVAEMLKEKGFEYTSLSDEIRAEVKKRGLDEGLDNLITVGNELRAKEGPATLSKRVLKRIKEGEMHGNKDFIVDSIRNPAEIEELKKNKRFILIAVDAPIELRYDRIKLRKRASDSVSFEKFRGQEEVQLKGGKTGQQLLNCMGMADLTMINDGSLEKLRKNVDDLLKKKDK
ncbi:hypothetical protein COV19_05930 [Candidatus Woesearchaeota archaeon CG10_big_fil_rev_8_21_14_0_10_44_13]|nr:MAG: hypothetical protein COV19_05930 [Candidatus Woesearchaeota archaeon CG10_big_fil_rev_8_21_14_0_10_44_13]